MAKKSKTPSNQIAQNRQARHNYFIEKNYEAGIVLEGWEVKSLRAGKVQINESYVFIRNGEIWLFGALISPLLSASTHIKPDGFRNRKLLLHKDEIARMRMAVERKGYSLVPITLYWKNGKVKCDVGLGKGKQEHDKRATEKERDWSREKARIMKKG